MTVAASTGIKINIYDEVDVSCSSPERQAFIQVLITVTEQEWLHSYLQSALRNSVKHQYEMASFLA